MALPITDAFNQNTGTNLVITAYGTSAWSLQEGSIIVPTGNLGLFSPTGGSYNTARRNDETPNANQYSQITITSSHLSEGLYCGPAVRCQVGANSQYHVETNGSEVYMSKCLAGTQTTFPGFPVSQSFAAGDKLRLSVIGTTSPVTLLCYKALAASPTTFTFFVSAADSSSPITNAGQLGIFAYGSVGAGNKGPGLWEGGNLAAGSSNVTVSAGPLSASYSIPAPNIVLGGNKIVSVGVLSASYSIPAPSVSFQVNVSIVAQVLNAAYSTPAPTVSTTRNTTVSVQVLSASYTLSPCAVLSDYGTTIAVGVLSGTYNFASPTLTVQNSLKSLRQRIIEALKFNLEQIQVVNGYNNNMGDVLIVPKAISQLKNFPAVNIQTDHETVLNLADGSHTVGMLHYQLPVHVDVYLNKYQDTTTAREQVLADIEKQFMNNVSLPDSNGESTVSELRLKENIFFGQSANLPYPGVSLSLLLLYHQNILDPAAMQ